MSALLEQQQMQQPGGYLLEPPDYAEPYSKEEFVNPRGLMFAGLLSDVGGYLASGGRQPLRNSGLNMWMQANQYNARLKAANQSARDRNAQMQMNYGQQMEMDRQRLEAQQGNYDSMAAHRLAQQQQAANKAAMAQQQGMMPPGLSDKSIQERMMGLLTRPDVTPSDPAWQAAWSYMSTPQTTTNELTGEVFTRPPMDMSFSIYKPEGGAQPDRPEGRVRTADQEAYNKLQESVVPVSNSFKRLQQAVKEGGPSVFGEQASRLDTMKTEMMVGLKELATLGALDAGVERVIDDLIGDPTAIEYQLPGGQKRLEAKLEQAGRYLQDQIDVKFSGFDDTAVDKREKPDLINSADEAALEAALQKYAPESGGGTPELLRAPTASPVSQADIDRLKQRRAGN